MNGRETNKDGSPNVLLVRRSPARLNSEQTAQMLGFQAHDIPAIVRADLLKPLGDGAPNSVKYFAAFEIEEFSHDRRWLDKATRAVSRSRGSKDSAPTHARKAKSDLSANARQRSPIVAESPLTPKD